MAERDLVVRFIGDDRQLNQAFVRTERNTKALQSRMTSFNQTSRGFLSGFGGRTSLLFGSGAFIGSAALTAGLKSSVDAASDLNEQISKSRQVFGEASIDVERWSKTTASAMGISQRAAIAAAGTFGNLFRVINLAPEQSAEMSRALVKLASDLASFNNASPEDVLLAIRSGLIGEAEPLRRYGVLLSEARVQQRALADSGKTNIKTLTDQEKALARYQIIMSDTATAQGDFERTSGGLANQTRKLNAEMDDLSATIGSALVPGLTLLAMGLSESIGGLNDAIQGMRGFRDSMHDGGDAADGFNRRIDDAAIGLSRFARGLVDAVPGLTSLRDRVRDAAGGSSDLSRTLSQQLSPALRKTSTDADGYAVSLADAADRSGNLVHVTGILATSLADAATRFQDATDAIENAGKAAEHRFTTSIKGLDLKLKKARLTPGLQDDLAVLNEILDRINRRIRAEGRSYDLENQRVDVLLEIQSVEKQIASASESSARSARDAAASEKERAQAAREAAREAEREAAEARRARAEALQFQKLGLTATGQPRGPSVRNLRHRVGSLRNQIEGTFLDTPKTNAQLDRIQKVLSGKFGKVGRDVRMAILQMLNDIASALQSGTKKAAGAAQQGFGELTRGGIRSTEKLIKGLNLTPAQEEAIRRRNRGITRRGGLSAFGFAIGDDRGGRDRGRDRVPQRQIRAGRGGTFITIHGMTVVADDPDAFLRALQKKSSRTSGSRRGRHGGVRIGLG